MGVWPPRMRLFFGVGGPVYPAQHLVGLYRWSLAKLHTGMPVPASCTPFCPKPCLETTRICA